MCVCGFIHPSALEALEGDTTFLKEVSLTAKAGQGSSGHSLPLRAREDPSTPEPARQWLGVSCSWAESFPRCRPLPTKSLLPLTGFSMPRPRACRSRTAAAVCPQHSTVPAGAHHPTCTLVFAWPPDLPPRAYLCSCLWRLLIAWTETKLCCPRPDFSCSLGLECPFYSLLSPFSYQPQLKSCPV